MAKMYYQGHGSVRFETSCGKIVYLDPFAGDGYDLPADLILVSHAHGDHNKVELIGNRKEGCTLFTFAEAIGENGYNELDLGWIRVLPVKAQNKNHDPSCCVGFILFLDGKKIWAACDTSMYPEMEQLKEIGIDWALLPTDGKYNMGPEEAAKCAEMCGAAHAVPIHTNPMMLFDPAVAELFDSPVKTVVLPGETVEL